MTRGKFAVLLNGKLYMSIEFNGDMYPSYNGKLVYFLLNYVETLNDFLSAIQFFDAHIFHYSEYVDNITDIKTLEIDENLDFSLDYIRNFHSDYLYIKNLDTKPYNIKNCLDAPNIIEPHEIQIWNFGNKIETATTELSMTNSDMSRLGITKEQ